MKLWRQSWKISQRHTAWLWDTVNFHRQIFGSHSVETFRCSNGVGKGDRLPVCLGTSTVLVSICNYLSWHKWACICVLVWCEKTYRSGSWNGAFHIPVKGNWGQIYCSISSGSETVPTLQFEIGYGLVPFLPESPMHHGRETSCLVLLAPDLLTPEHPVIWLWSFSVQIGGVNRPCLVSMNNV